jgi:hypothetical protein
MDKSQIRALEEMRPFPRGSINPRNMQTIEGLHKTTPT